MCNLRLFGVVLACATLFIPVTSNATFIEFEFSGDSDPLSGPVVPMSVNFTIDTSTAFYTQFYPADDPSYVGNFSAQGAITESHVAIGNEWNSNTLDTFSLYHSVVTCGDFGCYTELYVDACDSTIDKCFITVGDGLWVSDSPTLLEWVNSPDPLADLLLSGFLNTTVPGIVPTDNPDYRYGFVEGWNLEYTITKSVPEPSTFALLILGFVGIGAARKLKKH